jgi:hypothetical protein
MSSQKEVLFKAKGSANSDLIAPKFEKSAKNHQKNY